MHQTHPARARRIPFATVCVYARRYGGARVYKPPAGTARQRPTVQGLWGSIDAARRRASHFPLTIPLQPTLSIIRHHYHREILPTTVLPFYHHYHRAATSSTGSIDTPPPPPSPLPPPERERERESPSNVSRAATRGIPCGKAARAKTPNYDSNDSRPTHSTSTHKPSHLFLFHSFSRSLAPSSLLPESDVLPLRARPILLPRLVGINENDVTAKSPRLIINATLRGVHAGPPRTPEEGFRVERLYANGDARNSPPLYFFPLLSFFLVLFSSLSFFPPFRISLSVSLASFPDA